MFFPKKISVNPLNAVHSTYPAPAFAPQGLPFPRWLSSVHLSSLHLPILRLSIVNLSSVRLCLGLGAAACLPALAAPDDVLHPYVGYSVLYEDNVLGIPDGAEGGRRSDTSQRTEAGLNAKKRVSQQVFSAKLNFANVKHQRLGALDNVAKDLQANWNWHVGEHVEGNLGASYVQAMTPFINFHGQERNLRTQRREFADAAWHLHPSWRVRTGLVRDQLRYELDSQKAGNRKEASTELGLDYLAAGGSTIGAQLRHTRGDLPNLQRFGAQLVDNSYNQNEAKAKVSWQLTGKTQLQFLGGYVQRKHDAFPARDYSGLNARVIANWQPTGKVGLALSGWREIGALDDVTASYTLNQGFSLGSSWDLSSKVRLDGQLKHESSDFSGSAAFASLPELERKDTFRTASLKLSYRPIERLQLGAMIYLKNKNSTLGANDSANNGVMLNSRYEF